MRKVALITGGTRGIGLGIAQALSQSGFNLILCGRRPQESINDVLSSLKQSGTDVWYIQADMGIPSERNQLLQQARTYTPHLNALINNAGMAPRERNHILEATEESFEEVLNVNLKGPYFLTQSCAQWMIESKKNNPLLNSCIVNVNSISSTVASIFRGEYCISKAGLSMATKLWAVALAEHDIPVYEIRPGLIATDMTSGVQKHYDKLITEGLLLEPRWGTPEDIGKTVVALVRGDIPYATGQVIVQDGGLTLNRL